MVRESASTWTRRIALILTCGSTAQPLTWRPKLNASLRWRERVEWTYPEDADFVVLADTEGNLFCVIA